MPLMRSSYCVGEFFGVLKEEEEGVGGDRCTKSQSH